MKMCTKCKIEKPLSEFYNRFKSGKNILQSHCKICSNENRPNRKRKPLSAEKRKEYTQYNAAVAKSRRRDPEWIPYFIWMGSRNEDRKCSRENDLTVDSIKNMIGNGCQYCGETKIRMTLDRIDNSIGHLHSNVVPCCYRCNVIRTNMPYEAFLEIAPAIRSAREKNLFGEWNGHGSKRIVIMGISPREPAQ